MSRRREVQRLRTAAEAGDKDSAWVLAGELEKDGDLSGARHWYQVAAEAGQIHAATDLGCMLEKNGDIPGAEFWYRLAASADDMCAAICLGELLSQGGRFEEGVEWLKRAALSKDPEWADLAASGLGLRFMDRRNLDEAERWFRVALAAGYVKAKEGLRAVDQLRRDEAQAKVRRSPCDESLQTFEVTSVMFYDGSGHRLGPSFCSLTNTRLIIDSFRGGIRQVSLQNINSVSSPSNVISPLMLRINVPGAAYDIYCKNRDQKDHLEAWISRAIRGA